MKTSTVFSTPNRLQTNKGITTTLLIAFVLLCFTTPSNLIAQDPDPGQGITVRFANPVFLPANETYCVDVEFRANSGDDGVELFGINARFFVDYDLFDFQAFEDFQGGYELVGDVITSTGDSDFFGFAGDAALFVNQAIEKVNTDASPIILSDTEWKYLFKVCFTLKDESYLEFDLFCPSIVWDLRQEGNNGFPAGSDGLVMTVVSDGNGGCILASEVVEQFNWEYDSDLGANRFGVPITDPDQLACTSTRSIPLPSWALAVVAMCMMVFVVIRRIY